VGAWGIARPQGCAWQEEISVPEAFDALVQARVTVLRIYAFPDVAGPNQDDFERLDALVEEARRSGIRLLLLLDHGHNSCSGVPDRDDAWFGGGYQTPDPGLALALPAWAERVARRYRDEPAVLGYTPTHGLYGANAEELYAFAEHLSGILKSEAPDQLVTLEASAGSDGTTLSGDAPTPYERLHSLDTVDFVSVVDYSDRHPDVAAHVDAVPIVSAALGKPAVVTEAGFVLTETSLSLTDRAARADKRIGQWYAGGFAGAVLWDFYPGWQPPQGTDVTYSFDGRAAEPLMGPTGVLSRAPW
jgi:hypothetical protein